MIWYQLPKICFRKQVNVNVDQVYLVVIAHYAEIDMRLLMVSVLHVIMAVLVI